MSGKNAREFWQLRDDPECDPRQLAAIAAAELIRHASASARKVMERDRLLRLRDIVAPGCHGRKAAATVVVALAMYERTQWHIDRERGFSVGRRDTDSLCFEVQMLSEGKLSSRKLQNIFSPLRKHR